jgi:predicted ATPase/class 3 adenylate cyclase
MSALRALLLTDVVDSTKLATQVGDAQMARLWAEHDRAARDLLPRWHGREIDKTDGMLLLFDKAADAVGYALTYQKALNQLVPPLKARAGLHVGLVTLRENAPSDVALGAKPLEVEGVAKATAARVMSVAMGGQILLSADARHALDEGCVRLQSHGHWRLKGLEEPIELFEIGDDRTHFTPPPDVDKAYRVVRQGDLWVPVREMRHSLPSESDAFVGRTDALAQMSRRIQSGARLVSVLGIGGTGKTRLVLRYGRSWLGEYPGGVWFCDLAPARGVDGIVSAVAQGLDISLGSDDPVVQLGRAIAARGTCLVILDNFEQVARHAARTVGQWLTHADQARFIVTSREVLGVHGEVVLALPPLDPTEGATLFMQRAQAAKPDFLATAEDLAATARLVALLDGLPLAIELAAARVRVMSPRMLLARMSERFKLLASKSGGRLDRQSTLRAAFDWSWDLLTTAEKATLAQLSVFAGGFTLEAAEGVLDLSKHKDAPWTVDAMNSLVDKSFVRARGNERFDLLVSVQVYAAEHLQTEGRYAGSGPQALRGAQERHAAWFAALGPIRAIEGGCADLDNLVAACQRAVSLGMGDCAADALDGAWAALYFRGPYETGAELAESVCAMPRLGDRAAAHARLMLANASIACGRSGQAETLYEQALTFARAAGDSRCETRVMRQLGVLLSGVGRTSEARAQVAAAIKLALGLRDPRLECEAISGLGNLEHSEGHRAEALVSYEHALTLARGFGDRNVQSLLLGNLATVHGTLGQIDEAKSMIEETLILARETGNRRLEGNMLCNLGTHYLIEGRLDRAHATSQAALALARELGAMPLERVVRCNLGIVFERLALPDKALAEFEAAVRMAHSLNEPRSEGQILGCLGLLHARQGRHEDARRCLDSAELLLRSVFDRLGLGLHLTSLAEARQLAGDTAAAKASLAAATAIAAEVGADPSSEFGLALTRVQALVKSV